MAPLATNCVVGIAAIIAFSVLLAVLFSRQSAGRTRRSISRPLMRGETSSAPECYQVGSKVVCGDASDTKEFSGERVSISALAGNPTARAKGAVTFSILPPRNA